ncbi:MAG: DMT family transporter [Micavibrio sp.]|nr:DMT family transporter [Micavibrio sp.]
MSDQNRPYLAAGFMLTAAFMIVLQNTFAKLMGEAGLNPIEMAFYRNAGGLILIALLITCIKKKAYFKTERPLAQLNRAVIGNICLSLIFWANTLLPLATVTAILLSAPIIATALSPLFLKERISWVRWGCITLGFLGAIIITNPESGTLDWRYAVAITASFASALTLITLRQLGKTENALTTNFYFFGLGSLITAPIFLFVSSGFSQVPLLVIAIIIAGVLNQTLKTKAFRHGDVSFLSPLNYLNIVWATVLGWAIWDKIPDIHVYIGCGVIIISNVLITLREHQLKKRKNAAD